MTEKDILSKVIGVEKEIQDKLMLEKERSLEWVEKVRKEAEESISKEETRLRESFESAKAGFRTEAEKKAAEILAKADKDKERISSISDDTLGRILEKYVATILPAEGLSEDSKRSGARNA